jgi:thiamine biosynthesis lipoprotein
MSDRTFTALGTEVRLIGEAGAIDRGEAWTREAEAVLTRFDAGSELSRLNRDPRERVPVSPLLAEAIAAAARAAQSSEGLVDPSLASAVEEAGYDRTYGELDRIPLRAALSTAPPRRPARGVAPRVVVENGHVERTPGVRVDLGGTAKGFIADRLVEEFGLLLADCGGDIRTRAPLSVLVEHPLTGEHVASLHVDGAVATSGLARRVWRTHEGVAHHLLDPSTGRPAWTGLAGVTALAPTALDAETFAKTAYLSGPDGAREVLRTHGGVLLHEDGSAEEVAGTSRPPIPAGEASA